MPFLFATATSFQSSLQGATQRKVRSYFRALRTLARKEGGAIGFIDEFDAIGGARGGMVSFSPSPILAQDGLSPAMHCGGLEGLPSVGAPATHRHSPSTARRPGMAVVNELLVQMQSFDALTGWQRFVGRIIDRINLLLPDGAS